MEFLRRQTSRLFCLCLSYQIEPDNRIEHMAGGFCCYCGGGGWDRYFVRTSFLVIITSLLFTGQIFVHLPTTAN